MTGRSHTTGSFTRGSQLFLHSLRMVTQGSKAAILGGLFCVLVLCLPSDFVYIRFILLDDGGLGRNKAGFCGNLHHKKSFHALDL